MDWNRGVFDGAGTACDITLSSVGVESDVGDLSLLSSMRHLPMGSTVFPNPKYLSIGNHEMTPPLRLDRVDTRPEGQRIRISHPPNRAARRIKVEHYPVPGSARAVKGNPLGMFSRPNEHAVVLFQPERDVCGCPDNAAKSPGPLAREQPAPKPIG
jgi:hypothetical protein